MKLVVNKRVLDLSEPKIMGILNVTPDSFFDGGRYCTVPKAIDYVSSMITNGADLIDVGGESTRPGADPVEDEEEAERVIPVVQEISKRFDIFISVNTSRALVIQESATAGAHLINDVRSLTDVGSIESVVNSDLLVCLMHMQGVPKTMQQKIPDYRHVVHSVNDYFIKQILRCELAGINRKRLLIDPGFGFGKSVIHNYQLLANLRFFQHFNLPILVGISRKSMLNIGNNQNNPQERLISSISAAVIAIMQNVQIIRVHDVKETTEALKVANRVLQQQKIDCIGINNNSRRDEHH